MNILLKSAIVATSAVFGMVVVAQPFPVFAAVTKHPVQVSLAKKTSAKKVVAKKPLKKVAKKTVTKKYRVGEVAPLDPTNPGAQSRCMTPKIQGLYTAATTQMEKDITAKGKGFPTAVADYRQALTLTWEAMKEPYCGTGTHGVSAVISSFQKTISRTRADFLRKTQGTPESTTNTTSAANTDGAVSTSTHS